MNARFGYAICGVIIGSVFLLCAFITTSLSVGNAGIHSSSFAPIFNSLYALTGFVIVGLGFAGFLIGGKQDKTSKIAKQSAEEARESREVLKTIVDDISDRKQLEATIAHNALYDNVTGLPNRTLLVNKLDAAIASLGDKPLSSISVLHLDLDNFRNVNDTLGFEHGNSLLGYAAKRFSGVISPTDTVARLGADQFAFFVNEAEPGYAMSLAKRLIASLVAPFHLKTHQFRIGASIGITYGRIGSTAASLLRDAEIAAAEVKKNGKNGVGVFRADMHAVILNKIQTSSEIRTGLRNNEFFLVYQPIVDLSTRNIVGMEALVRWNHPTRKFVSPLEFVTIAEETGTIIPLGICILRKACQQMAAWNKSHHSDRMTMTINVSPIQLKSDNFLDDVYTAIIDSGVKPHQIVLEITESAFVADTKATLAIFINLKALGVRLAIDDFGTGYSSLSHLHRFPFDVLKIDKSFVDGLDGETNSGEVAFARAIVALGHELKMRVLAEGIESENQLEILKNLGCQFGQGYLFAKPLDAANMAARIAKQQFGSNYVEENAA